MNSSMKKITSLAPRSQVVYVYEAEYRLLNDDGSPNDEGAVVVGRFNKELYTLHINRTWEMKHYNVYPAGSWTAFLQQAIFRVTRAIYMERELGYGPYDPMYEPGEYKRDDFPTLTVVYFIDDEKYALALKNVREKK